MKLMKLNWFKKLGMIGMIVVPTTFVVSCGVDKDIEDKQEPLIGEWKILHVKVSYAQIKNIEWTINTGKPDSTIEGDLAKVMIETDMKEGETRKLKVTHTETHAVIDMTVTLLKIEQSLVDVNTKIIDLTKPGIKLGDYVNFKFEGFIDGEKFEGGSGTKTLKIGSNQFIPGFETGMIGMRENEIKDIHLKFPDDYGNKTVAGKPVTFKVTVYKIYI